MSWVSVEVARIEREGAQLSEEYIAAIVDRFRRQVGGAYELIAARIESDHER